MKILIALCFCQFCFANWIPVISDRENFQFTDALSACTQYKLVDLNRAEPTQRMTIRDLLNAVRDKNVLVIIHGFNMSYTWSLEQFRTYHNTFGDQYDQVIGYLWPGGNQWWEYRDARRRTLDELPYRLLSIMGQFKVMAKNVDVLAHSMGCRLTLEMLNLTGLPLVRNLFLTAPAVSSTALQINQRYHHATQKAKNIYVFYSQYDEVSSYAFPIVEGEKSLGLSGPKQPDLLPFNVTAIDCSHCIDDHSGYDHASFFRSYINKIIEAQVK